MTPTEKQKCIAEQSVYGDLRVIKPGQETEMERRLAVTLERVPILRPLSDLTKEITHKGYNEDKPFVPAAIIGKMDLGGDYAINVSLDSLRKRRHTKENDLLHLWHFDTRNLIEKGEAVDVHTLDINPYSVQQ